MADSFHVTENPPETLTDADIERLMRQYRNKLLRECDWTQLVDSVVPDQAAWATYRQQLRDAPESWTVGQPWTPPDPPA
jgi:hypothetical protein